MKKRIRVPIKVKFKIWKEEDLRTIDRFFLLHTFSQNSQITTPISIKYDVNLSMKDVPDMKQGLVTYYKYWMKVYMR